MSLPRTTVTLLVESPTAPLRLTLTTGRNNTPEVAVTVEQIQRYGEAPEWERVGLFSLSRDDALAFADALVLVTVTGGRRG